jgi:coenzyme F420 hydrogenase subunit beta
MKFVPIIQQVIDNDHCITCGACIQVCPEKTILSEFNKKRLAFEVKIREPDKCIGCPAPCDNVCPSITSNFMDLLKTGNKEVLREGPIENVYTGYSETQQINGVSSSGGIIRAFIKMAFKNGDPVLCLTRQGQDYLPEIINEESQIDRIPGSIYHSIDFNNALGLILQAEKPVLIVATPCQLAGIQNYITKYNPGLSKNIKLTIGLICGWSFSHHSIEALKIYNGIHEPVIDVTYRGEDQIGNLKIKTVKKTYIYNRAKPNSFREWINYRASFSRTLNRLRCRVCQDHTNILADIAVGDAWLKRTRGKKLSIIITRNLRGETALNQLIEKSDIHVEKTDMTDIIESQSKNLVYGIDARKMESYLISDNIHTQKFIFNKNDPKVQVLSKSDESFLKFGFFKRSLVFAKKYKKYRTIYMLTSIKALAIERYIRLKRKIFALIKNKSL